MALIYMTIMSLLFVATVLIGTQAVFIGFALILPISVVFVHNLLHARYRDVIKQLKDADYNNKEEITVLTQYIKMLEDQISDRNGG